jgi:hypothetical protein
LAVNLELAYPDELGWNLEFYLGVLFFCGPDQRWQEILILRGIKKYGFVFSGIGCFILLILKNMRHEELIYLCNRFNSRISRQNGNT